MKLLECDSTEDREEAPESEPAPESDIAGLVRSAKIMALQRIARESILLGVSTVAALCVLFASTVAEAAQASMAGENEVPAGAWLVLAAFLALGYRFKSPSSPP